MQDVQTCIFHCTVWEHPERRAGGIQEIVSLVQEQKAGGFAELVCFKPSRKQHQPPLSIMNGTVSSPFAAPGSATRTGFQGRCFGYNRFRLWFHTNFKESHFKHRIGTNSFLKLAKVYSLIIHSNHYFVSDVGNPQVRAGFLHLPSTVHCTEPSVMQIILEYKTALCERTLQLKSGFLPRFALKNHF